MNSAIVSPEDRQAIVDEEQLRLLAIAHYIDGGLCIMASDPSFFPPPKSGHNGPPEAMFRILGAVLGLFILAGWAFGALTIYVGRCIRRRTKRVLTLVVACLNLLFVPVGTLLGVATIIVLGRSSVKKAYEV